ncbi:glycogenin-2 isoform X2 [Hypanus sabinus]|uniref:glycogenin-2 isoform X2 n=1 Tax=Hypanus sabinus TaxID=79690 RepID=UPI0028C4AC13|nr:glycogenin-2 isoform X2 [Hypanus sabinus]
MPVVTDQAFVTLATNDAYAKGALVLCQSLKRHNTTRQVVVLFTPQVSGKMRHALQCLFDEAREVNVLDSRDSAHLALLSRPELGITFTKIHCWCLVQYSKCVFMDADTLVCQNIDELFEREELSAAPDPGWPDCFNTGVFVYVPSVETYDRLLQFAVENGSFDGGDQGLLNSFFRNWSTMDIHKHLPFIYNLASIVLYSYLPAFKQFGASVKVVHFLGPTKPWHHTYSVETKSAVQESMSPMDSTFINFLNTWWDIYTTSIMPLLTQENGEKRETQKMPQVSTWQVSTIGQKETDAKEKTSLEPEKSEPVMDSQVQPAHVQPPQPPDSTGLSEPRTNIPQAKFRQQIVPVLKTPRKSALKMVHDNKRTAASLRAKRTLESSTSQEVEKGISWESSPSQGEYIGERHDEFGTRDCKGHALEMVCIAEELLGVLKADPSLGPNQPASANKEDQKSVQFVIESRSPSPEMIQVKEISPDTSEQTVKEEITDSFLALSLGSEPVDPDQAQDRRRWEEGNMDYMGKDAFANIQKKLDKFLK